MLLTLSLHSCILGDDLYFQRSYLVYSINLELLTNATVVDDAIRLVAQKGAAANPEPSSCADSIVVEKEKQQPLLENNNAEQESEVAFATSSNFLSSQAAR
jgi:hypothetical protein